jgi:hypothetical protein
MEISVKQAATILSTTDGIVRMRVEQGLLRDLRADNPKRHSYVLDLREVKAFKESFKRGQRAPQPEQPVLVEVQTGLGFAGADLRTQLDRIEAAQHALLGLIENNLQHAVTAGVKAAFTA